VSWTTFKTSFQHSPLEKVSPELKREEDILLELRNIKMQNDHIIDILRRIEQKL